MFTEIKQWQGCTLALTVSGWMENRTSASFIGKAVEANVTRITCPSSNPRLATALPCISVARSIVTAHTVTSTRLATGATWQVPCTGLSGKMEGEHIPLKEVMKDANSAMLCLKSLSITATQDSCVPDTRHTSVHLLRLCMGTAHWNDHRSVTLNQWVRNCTLDGQEGGGRGIAHSTQLWMQEGYYYIRTYNPPSNHLHTWLLTHLYTYMYYTQVSIHMLTLALLCCSISIETFYTHLTLLSCGIVGADEALSCGSVAWTRNRWINVSIAFTRHARDCWWVAVVTIGTLATQWSCVSLVTSALWRTICKGSATGPKGEGKTWKVWVEANCKLRFNDIVLKLYIQLQMVDQEIYCNRQ